MVLQCVHLFNSKEITNYYKITKKLFTDEPYKIYSTSPRFQNGQYTPSLDGYWNESEESKSAWENVSKKKDISKYSYPDWYTFVSLVKEKNGSYNQNEVFYFINRETLIIEIDYGFAEYKTQCVISDDKHFDERFESDKNSKLKNKKI